MSYMINNNAFEVDPSPRKKRKRSLQCSKAYMNPALDLLSTEDAMCNTMMEVAPAKRSRRSRSCDSRVTFENPALDTGIKRMDINGLLRKELSNVNEKLQSIIEICSPMQQQSFQDNNTSNNAAMEEKSLSVNIRYHVNSTPVVSYGTLKRSTSFDLSFIEKLGIEDDPNTEALYLDDDLNESNIMEIKTIVTKSTTSKPKTVFKSTNPFLNDMLNYNSIEMAHNQTTDEPLVSNIFNNFPFNIPATTDKQNAQNMSSASTSSFEATCESADIETASCHSVENNVVARRLFLNDISDSIKYADDDSIISNVKKFGHSTLNEQPNYNFTSPIVREAPVYVFGNDKLNKQSKILGCDVTNITRSDIFNCDIESTRPNHHVAPQPSVTHVQATFVDNSENLRKNRKAVTKSNNKISSKIFGKIKDVFKHDKKQTKSEPITGNPYEVIRKPTVEEKVRPVSPVCFENPALNLNTTDIEIEEENGVPTKSGNFKKINQFEITPMKRNRANAVSDKENRYASNLNDCIDLSDYQMDIAAKKQVRFDATLNHEKVITGNSFDSDQQNFGNQQSPEQVFHAIDTQLDEYHNELENCFNEKKFITQNL